MEKIRIEDLTPREAIKRLNKLITQYNPGISAQALEKLLDLESENKAQLKRVIEIADDLAVNLTDLYNKMDSTDSYVYGMLPSLAIEIQNHRIAFRNMFKALDLPYDEIDGWDKLNESEKKKVLGRSNRLRIRDFFRTRKAKKSRGKTNGKR